ncbi:MAG: O-methyltransferase [Nitrososphaerota archaeon]
MEQKIEQIILRLQKQADYENKHKDKIAHEKRMLAITKETAMFYNILLKAAKAKKILEIGLSTGYSTLWFADVVIYNTKKSERQNSITTIEQSKYKIQIAKKNFHEAGVSEIIDIKEGIALDVLSDLSKKFEKSQDLLDFVFIDADKENSIEYFETCLPMVKKGGIIAADNILDNDDMKKYAKYVQKKPDVISVTVPIGWGEEITFKTK